MTKSNCASVSDETKVRAAASVGYSRLKPVQEEALSLFVNRRVSCLLAMASHCFALLPRVMDMLKRVERQSIVFVVCPSVALINEHIAIFIY